MSLDRDFLYTLRITLVATIGGFLFGFDSGVINGTVDGLRIAFNSDSVGTGFNVASMLLGCAAGAFFGGSLADRYGRRGILFVAAICFIVSAWGSGIATGSLEFVLYRVLGGLAVGAASVLSPAYISEVTPAHRRGTLSSLQQIAIIAGLFASFLSNYLLVKVAGSGTQDLWLGQEAWRWMFWMELIPATLFLLALFTIPESPRFLVARGRREEAAAVFARLGGGDAQARVREVDASLASDHHRPTLGDLRAPGGFLGLRTLVWVGIGLAVFQQLVGINVVFYYGAVLWQAAGFNEEHALLINVISGAVSIAGCVLATSLIDKRGRKPLLVVGSIVMSACLTVMAFVFAGAEVGATGNLALSGREGILALLAANVYVFAFNLSWGPVMWVLLGEMFPNQIRGSGLAVSGLAQWLANFGITMTFPMILAGFGLGVAYGLYAAFAILSTWFVLRLVRETKGMRLEEMQG